MSEPTIPIHITEHFGQIAAENKRLREVLEAVDRWYVNRYQAKGEYVHVVGPDGLVFTVSLRGARELADALIAECGRGTSTVREGRDG